MKKSLLIFSLVLVLCLSVVFAACAPTLDAETLERMQTYLTNTYRNDNPAFTYNVVNVVSVKGQTANVKWTVTTTKGPADVVTVGNVDGTNQAIEIDFRTEEAVEYTLTGTLTNEKGKEYKIDGNPVSVSFNRTVKAFVLNTYEEYVAACKASSEEEITIVAYVIGVVNMDSSSAGSLYLQDADGNGYYAYKPTGATTGCETDEDLRAKWPIGAEVVVTGTGTVYGGQYEFNKDCGAVATGATVDPSTLAYVDATADFAAATSNEDTSLLEYQNRRVTLKDATITRIDTEYKDGELYKRYYYFTLPGSDVEFNVYYTIYFIDEATMQALDAKLAVGTMVDLTGVISVYSKDYQVYPDSANSVSNVREITYTDAEKVAIAKDNLAITGSASEGDVIELPAAGTLDTTIAWAFAEGQSYDFATLADGKLTITATPSATTKIQLVATITSGTASDTKALEVTVAGTTFEIINLASASELALAQEHNTYTADKYYIMGTVKDAPNSTYGNMYIVDEKGNEFYVYGVYDATGANRYDAMENAPVAGDVVVLWGVLGQFNGTAQMKNAWAVACYKTTSLTKANELASAQEHNTYTADKYYVMGTVKDAPNSTYGNMYIVDAEGNELYVYGVYDATGANRYDAMANAPQAGEVVILYGVLGQFNGTAQMKNAWAVVVAPAGEAPAAHTCESKCEVCGGCADAECTDAACATKCTAAKETHTLTVAEALTLGAAQTSYTTGKYYVTGVITEVSNTTYGNMYIADENGNTILIYGTYDATGANRYDAMANAPVAGDTVTIYGIVGQFNGTAQIKNGWIVEHTPAGSVTPPAHTCESVCPTCGKCTDEDCAETVCADKCPGHTPVVVLEDVVVNVSDITTTGEFTTEQTLATGVTVLAKEGKAIKINGNNKEIDGFAFTQRLQLGGSMAEDNRAIKLEIQGACTITVYAISSSSDAGQERNMLLKDSTFTTVDTQVVGLSICKVQYTVTAAGTYYLGSESSGINVYYIAISYSASEEPVAVVINGVNYSEAQAEAALLALQAGDVVTILANATIAQEYTFVAANYTLGEGATLTIKANVVAPAGAKLTVSAGATIVVEAGAHIDISALTQDDFATSTSARLAIAAGAKVTMPAYAEALWNDAYLKVVIEAMVANSEVGAELVLGETELTKTANGWEAKAPAFDGVTTIADALSAAEGTAVELTGTVSEIYQSWNSQYSNMSFYITDGTNRILIFRTGTQVGVGDTVSVSGTVTVYNEVNQIAQGATTTITAVHECSDFTPADCLNAAACTVCGETSGEALGHTEANAQGKCDRCGADVGSAASTITASKTIAELIVSEGWTSSTTKQTFNLDDNVTVKINGGSNTGKAYNGDHIRIYATDSPAGTITISVPEGYELVSVKITAATGTYAFLYLGDGTTDICNQTVSVSGQSIVLNSVKNGSDGKQVRVTAIEVVYAPVAE